MSPESGWARGVQHTKERMGAEPPLDSSPGDITAALTESGAVVLEQGEHVSTQINEAQFEGLSAPILRDITEVVERAAVYLQRPVVADSFEDQHERRAWRTAIKTDYTPEVSDFFESNRLRLNALSPLLYKIPGLRTTLSREAPTNETMHLIRLLDDFLNLTGPVPSFEMRYKPMTLNEKLEFTRAFSDAARSFVAHTTRRDTLAQAA
jgi:hypothetical protein